MRFQPLVNGGYANATENNKIAVTEGVDIKALTNTHNVNFPEKCEVFQNWLRMKPRQGKIRRAP